MMNTPAIRIYVVAMIAIVCAACVPTGQFSSNSDGARAFANPAGTPDLRENYGDDFAVRTTLSTVKTQGHLDRVSSQAVRLPERPLSQIAVYDYRFPAACGGHQFRVYEADGMQILEYEYNFDNGDAELVRDYISGPSPFVQSGLWTAYDHTVASISSMTSRFEQPGIGSYGGGYSRGLHTNLPEVEQREIGRAYNQALSDVTACRDICETCYITATADAEN